MKKTISIFLLVVFLVQNSTRLLIWSAFKINQDFIAENFCNDRFENINICRGSCFLEKEQNEEHKEQQNKPDLKTQEVVLYFANPCTALPLQKPEKNKDSYPILRISFLTSNYLSDVFRPPAFSKAIQS